MPEADNDIPAEFELASMGPSVQGKHAEAYRRHVRVVQLNDDLVGFYPTEASIVAVWPRCVGTRSNIRRRRATWTTRPPAARADPRSLLRGLDRPPLQPDQRGLSPLRTAGAGG